MTSTRDRQRAAARAKLEREMAERAGKARKRRQTQAIVGAAAGLVLVVAGTVWLATSLGGDDDEQTGGTTTADAVQCAYTEVPKEGRPPQIKDVGLPPTQQAGKGSQTMTIDTNLGPITAKIDRAAVPCTAGSFTHLASKGFFDNTKCHRLVTEGIKVLQCGAPRATGKGWRDTAGTGGPALVLFHESPQASNVFAPALPALGRTLRAFAFDTPRYGLSDPPRAPLEIPGYARLLLDAVDALGITEFAVAGQHTGASLALAVAQLAGPDRVTHAILSGLVLDQAERERLGASWAPDKPIDPAGRHLQDLWARYLDIWEGPPELVNLAVANIASVFERYNWAYRAAFAYDPTEPLRALPCPVLLLTAARDMLADGDALAQAIRPDAVAVRLTDTTGQLPWRVPEEFAAVLSSFVTTGRLVSDRASAR